MSDSNFFPKTNETHLVVVYAPADGGTRIYINGKLDASGGAPDALNLLQDVNNYLGRSGYNGDPPYFGSFDEFRIYDGAVSGAQAASDYTAGPNTLPGTIPPSLPALSVSFKTGHLFFTWPSSATNATLVVSQTLGTGAAWGPVNATVNQTNGVFSATVTPTQSPSFYRLKQ